VAGGFAVAGLGEPKGRTGLAASGWGTGARVEVSGFTDGGFTIIGVCAFWAPKVAAEPKGAVLGAPLVAAGTTGFGAGLTTKFGMFEEIAP